MKKASALVKKFIVMTCILYTVISYAMMLLNLATVNAQAPEWSGVALLFSHILLFSALTALVHTAVGAFTRLNAALGQIIRFALTYAAFYLCFFAMTNSTSQPINIVVVSSVFVIVYALVCAVSGIISFLANKKNNDSSEYESVYSEVSTEDNTDKKENNGEK